MKAVMSSLSPDVAAMRRHTGSDRWDEVWEGTLHLPPMRNREHVHFQYLLHRYLDDHWAKHVDGAIYHDRNVAMGVENWTRDFRIPDLVLLAEDRLGIDKEEYIAGGPDVVVEIHTPDDESHDKLPFYATIGTREVWIIDRDSKTPEIYALTGETLLLQEPDEGWHLSAFTKMEMRADGSGKLIIRRLDNPSSERSLS